LHDNAKPKIIETVKIKHEIEEAIIPLSKLNIYLDQAAASISACALRYNSSLFARALRLSIIAGSSFSNEDRRLDFKYKFIYHISVWIISKILKLNENKSIFYYYSHLIFSYLNEEMVKQASFGFAHLTIDN
jgi:hypothetical protein